MASLHEILAPMLPFKLSDNAWDVIDAATLTAVVSPALYFLVFRKMRESTERFRQTLATAPNAIVIVNEQTLITDWNLSAQKMFQYSHEEALGQPMHQLIAPPRYRDDAEHGFARFQETGGGPLIGNTTEVTALRKDGSEFPVELSISAVKLKGRWYAIGIIRDITERKQAEELVSAQHAEIERARLDWQAVFDSISHPIFLHDNEFRVIRANRAYAEQAGKPFGEIIGQPYYTLFPKSDTPLPCCLRAMEKAEEEEEEVTVGDATYRSRTFSVRNEQGVYLYSVHILEDITERKRLEAVLRESEARFHALVDAAGDLIFTVAADGEVGYVNEMAARALHTVPNQVVGKRLRDLFPPETFEQQWRNLQKVFETGEPLYVEELTRFPHGEVWQGTWLTPLHDASGSIVAVLGASRDITERKRQEERTTALLELSTLAETLDEKTLLQRGLDTVQHLTGSRIGFLHFISEDQNEIELVTWSTDTLAHFCQAKFDSHYPVSKAGIWVNSVQLKQPLIVNDYATAPGKKGYPEGHADVQRFISVPILEGELVRMIVGVGNAARDYDEHDVETARLFGYDLYRIVQRKRADGMLRESEERFYHLFRNMSSGVAVYQPGAACEAFTLKSANKAAERIDQVRREDVVGRDVEEVFPGVRAFGLLEVFKRVCRSGESERFPTAFYQDERISGWRDNYVYRLDSGEIVAVYDDVTERKQNEEALIHTNRALMMLSANNEALVRATSEEELLQSATRAIVERGGYCMARVSYADDNPEKSLRRVAWAGTGEDFFAEQFLTWADTEKGQVPIARTIRSGTPQVCCDITSDPGFAPWKDAALAQGYVSNIGLPLSDGSRIFGGLSIYSSEKNAFGDEDAKLLMELANNLAYGIVTLRARAVHKLAGQKKLEAGALLKDALEDAIGAIAATLEQRDPYTAGHQRRVAQLATAIAEEMGLAREVIEGIHFGGLIHDLGKISVPAEILGKPGRLTDTEFGLIKVHAEAGYQIVKDIAFPWPVAGMVRQHHERLDGSGYPQGLKGDEIVLEARILAVADVVEAMSANRPYRPGFGMDAALDEITRGRGTQLDPVAVDACLRVIREKGFVFIK